MSVVPYFIAGSSGSTQSLMKASSSITPSLIAPCGMNCALCIAHLRPVNTCPGCNGSDDHKPLHCVRCTIKHCRELRRAKGTYCSDCEVFPCARLHQLDKRYSTKYGMSMIDNLKKIAGEGVRKFVRDEAKRWSCRHCGKLVSVHRPECIHCGAPRKSPFTKATV